MGNFLLLFDGFKILFTGQNAVITVLGAILGLIVGAMPGIGSLAGVAILLPLTYGMNPISAIVLLCSVYMACMFGGSYSAILLNIPGDAPAIMTTLDGYPLARKGLAGKALMTANMSSFVGGMIGMLILTLSSTWLARFGLKFGSAEMSILMLIAMSSITWIIGDNPTKGLIATLIGALLTFIGSDPISAVPRFNFGNIYLMGGLSFTPLVIGAIGFSQVITLVTTKDAEDTLHAKVSMKDSLLTAHEWARILPVCIRNGLIGTFIGVLPGAGPTVASTVGYTFQKKGFKSEVPMGEGAIEGIAASEASNNSACAGAFATLLGLGIPGSSTASVLLGGLMMWGLQPGPLLFKTNPDFAWTCIAALFFTTIIALLCGFFAVPFIARVIKIPNRILVPAITMVCLVGSYSTTRSMYGVYIMLVAGVACYWLTQNGYPLSPLLLAFVLVPMFETYMRRAIATSAGKWTIFVESGLGKGCLAILLFILLAPVFRGIFVKKKTV